jgi:hypothetical protein
MGSNGPPPKDYSQAPTSPPAPLARVKRDEVRRAEVSKSDGTTATKRASGISWLR